MKNLGQMMKQAQKMQERMVQMQDELAAMEIAGSSGGDMVRIVLSGKSEVKSIKIDPALLDPNEAEVLEDLIKAAFADAKAKVEAASAEKMKELTGGIQLPPGMSLPF